ncbi:MAG: hypothetical protein O2854_06470 [Chloroflexi bacterium]|nr:hypothetical protein [Chloroflexota bacterium]
MKELTVTEVQALAKAAGLDLTEPELTEASYHTNALLEAMENISEPGLKAMEHNPMLFPPAGSPPSDKRKG